MPTKDQLFDRIASEMALGDSPANDYNVRGSHMAGTGKNPLQEFTGTRIGTISFDKERGDLKVTVDPPPRQEEEK